MQILVKELTPEGLELSEAKDSEWLSEALASSQARPAPGAELAIRVRASATSGNVFVRGEMQTRLVLVCSRCAEEWLEPSGFPFQLVLAPAKEERGEEEEVELTKDDLEFTYYQREVIELDDALREAVILQLPEYPLCRPDCKGLCQRCGQDLNRGSCACRPEREADGRLARLKDFKL
jgi:uncharacterized protein